MAKDLSAKGYILKILERQDRSVGEIKKKAREKQIPEDEIEEAISHLQKIKIIDDRRYAESLARTYLNVRQAGKRYIENKLRQHLVSFDVIKEVLANISHETEVEQAKQAVEKWQKKNAGREFSQDKLFRYLISKGFGYEVIKQIPLDHKEQNIDDIE